MRDYSLIHLGDAALLRDLATLVTQDRVTTAAVLAHIAEVDARRLYAPAGYPSMHAYCVDELRLSEDSASKRIHAARAARRFPVLFNALAEGRIHLAGLCLLAPHLTEENVEPLVEAATHRRKAEIEELLARLFPRPELPAMVRALALVEHAPEHVGKDLHQHAPGHVGFDPSNHGCDNSHVGPAPPAPQAGGAATTERFLLQLTIGTSTRDKLRYAQALLSHAVPSGDVASVLDRALDALITQLEKRKVGAGTRRPRRRRSTTGSRYVPAEVRRGVWERDQGQCTFVGATGHRCQSRRFLEFDHVDPVAQGGEATLERMRLRCRAHNQYEAERTFGAEFMSRKRSEAKLAAAQARARTDGEAQVRAQVDADEAAAREQARYVLAGLRNLGCRVEEARRAAAFSETLECATLEERMRGALKFLSRKLDRQNAREGVRCA